MYRFANLNEAIILRYAEDKLCREKKKRLCRVINFSGAKREKAREKKILEITCSISIKYVRLKCTYVTKYIFD